MKRRAPSSLPDPSRSAPGDYLRACAVLRPRDAAVHRSIARLLAGPQAEAAATEAAQVAPPPPPAPAIEPAPPAPLAPRTRRLAPPPPPAQHEQATMGRADVVRVEPPRPTPPAWFSAAPAPGGAALDFASFPSAPPPAPDLLLSPQRSRAILGAAAATLAEAEIDVETLVERVAKGHAMAAAPRRTAPTLARGLQLLVDRSDAMLPFARDALNLVSELLQIVGESRLQVLSFVASPMRGCGAGARVRWQPYSSSDVPRRGGRVVCVTDLGIGSLELGDAAGAPDWERFAQLIKGLGCSVAALVPYPPARWPRRLLRAIELIPWDRTTTAASVARRLHVSRFAP